MDTQPIIAVATTAGVVLAIITFIVKRSDKKRKEDLAAIRNEISNHLHTEIKNDIRKSERRMERHTDKRIDDMNRQTNQRFDDTNRRIDDLKEYIKNLFNRKE